MNTYWESKVRNISMTKPNDIFSQINRLFGAKPSSSIPVLKIPPEKHQLILDAEIQSDSLVKGNEDNYLITNQTDKLNIIGAHFEATTQ